MWYGSNIAWGQRKEDMRHLIKYAESDDGIRWERKNIVTIGFDFPGEYAICKPCVLKSGNEYEMWFCSRGDTYRIRYARSMDGITWHRHEVESGLDVSPDGWDSDMIEYPFVFDHKGERYLLYAGNGFGRTGFGLAVVEVKLAWPLSYVVQTSPLRLLTYETVESSCSGMSSFRRL